MFWSKKKKPEKTDKKLSSAELRAQAMENARAARERIGEETLNKIAAAMQKKEQSAFEQARNKVKNMDQDKVADHIKIMLDEK